MLNIHDTERVIRVLVGFLMIVGGLLLSIWWIVPLGFYPLITGASGFCPLYGMLFVSTRR
jgi:hypothetical protein